jgi:hypothetical protein
MKPREWTTAFGLSKYLMSVEGPSSKLGLLITILYEDRLLPHNDWSVSHTAANRPEFVKQLRAAGTEFRRIGLAVHSQKAVEAIRNAAERLALKSDCLNAGSDKIR